MARAFPRGDYNADDNGGDRPNAPAAGVKMSGWSREEYLAGIFKVSDFPAPAPGTERQPGPQHVPRPRLRRRQPVAVEEVHVTTSVGEFRLDAFNAFNRVNLADPVMDLSNTNFGKVDVAAVAARVSDGVAAAVLSDWSNDSPPPRANRRTGRKGRRFSKRIPPLLSFSCCI